MYVVYVHVWFKEYNMHLTTAYIVFIFVLFLFCFCFVDMYKCIVFGDMYKLEGECWSGSTKFRQLIHHQTNCPELL